MFDTVTSPGNLDLAVAAVYIDFDARDVGGVLRGQECHHSRDFLWLSEPLHRDPRKHISRELIKGFLGQPGSAKDGRHNRPWCNRIHADATPD